MKKSLLSVLFLCLFLASFSTAGAKECGGSAGGYTLDTATGALTFDDACTAIAGGAFRNKASIVSVDLSNTSVTSIGTGAFSNCDSLASVKFPASLTSIGDGAFAYAPLASVDLSNTALTSIGNMAFEECNSLASIDLSNTALTAIGGDTFYNIASPSTITVTNGSKAHELLGGLNSVTGDPISSTYGNNSTLIVIDPPTPTPTPDPLDPTPLPTATPQPGNASGVVDAIRVVPLPEDEFGSYELDPVTGEKNYLLFHTYDICMDFLNNDPLCSGYERCYHK